MWDLIDKIGTVIGILSAMAAAWNSWKLRRETNNQREKDNQQICVKLRSQTQEYVFALEMRRGGLSRAEIQGLIGTLPINTESRRYEIKYLNSRDFSDQIARIREQEESFEFIIPCSDTELAQFKWESPLRQIAQG
jgi:hypothetical protein